MAKSTSEENPIGLLRARLKQDPIYVRYKSVVAEGSGTFSVEAMMKEARMLHETRKSRLLYSLRVSPQKLQDAVLVDMSNRARLSELKTSVMDRIELLETVMKAMKSQLHSQYREELSAVANNVAERNAWTQKILTKGIELQARLESSLSILDVYMKDIDQAAYALRATLDTLKIILDKKEGYQGAV